MNSINKISREELGQACHAALVAAEAERDDDELEMIWVMSQKPVIINAGVDGDGEEWTETNEPELAAWLSEEWEENAVNGSVYLCGSYDDEYGWFWSNSRQSWVSYCF
jgi:hypothetical protein